MTLKRFWSFIIYVKRRYSKFINYYYYCCVPKEISRGVLGTRVNPGTWSLNTDGVDKQMLESGKKKLQIQKYPYTCGRGLRRVSIGLMTMMLLWTLEISTRKKNTLIYPKFRYEISMPTNWRGHGVLVFQTFLVWSKKSKTAEKES